MMTKSGWLLGMKASEGRLGGGCSFSVELYAPDRQKSVCASVTFVMSMHIPTAKS